MFAAARQIIHYDGYLIGRIVAVRIAQAQYSAWAAEDVARCKQVPIISKCDTKRHRDARESLDLVNHAIIIVVEQDQYLPREGRYEKAPALIEGQRSRPGHARKIRDQKLISKDVELEARSHDYRGKLRRSGRGETKCGHYQYEHQRDPRTGEHISKDNGIAPSAQLPFLLREDKRIGDRLPLELWLKFPLR
jgi:hypothetical protein